jgi:hypothetical protein
MLVPTAAIIVLISSLANKSFNLAFSTFNTLPRSGKMA